MGNAFIGVSDDGTASAWNPAGLAQLRKPEFSLVGSSIHSSGSLEGYRSLDDRFTFTPRHLSTGAQFVDFASLAIPVTIRRPVTFQVGWRRLYNLERGFGGTVLREPTLLAPGEPVTEIFQQGASAGHVDVISFAAAVRATKRLSLGMSVDVWRGGWEFGESKRQSAEGGASDYLQGGQIQDFEATSLSFGAMFHLGSWRAGVVYHAPARGPIPSSDTLDSTLPPPGLSLRSSFGPGAEMKFPKSFGVGISWKPDPRWTLAFDSTHDSWRDWLLIDAYEDGEIVNFVDGEPPDTTSTRNTLSINVGAEWILQKQDFLVPFRFGFAYEPQGQRDPYLFSGYALKLLTFGVGHNTNRFKFDFAVQRAWFDVRRSEHISIESALLGFPDAEGLTQERFWRLKLSAIVRIADTDKLKQTLGRIFGGS